MTLYREEYGACLIEAGARDLQNGCHWQPWLRLTRRADGVSSSHTFDRLKSVFGTDEAALRYAAELGRSLADEGWGLGPAARNLESAARQSNRAAARHCAYRLRKSPLTRGRRTARFMVRALAGLLARNESTGAMPLEPRLEQYLAAAADHAELERRMRESERSATPIAVTFSH